MPIATAATAVARLCPTCGKSTPGLVCPLDGAPTFFVNETLVSQGPVAVGAIVGGYKVLGPIGRGGHATVYLAERPQGLGEVALKVLHIDRADAPAVRRFYREALIGARLSHPNTVRVFDVGQADNVPIFIAMELLRGETLEAQLQQRSRDGTVMPPAQAVALAIDVLKGLAEAHDQNVVHRDLKPGNLMLAQAGGETFVKIVDFGVAHMLDSLLTETDRAIGTPAYMSPEQCHGEEVDGRSDLYALGLILFRCLAGRAPFIDDKPLGLMYANATLPPPDLAQLAPQPLPQSLIAVVMRALAKDRRHRFADARKMRDALQGCQAELAGHVGGAVAPAPLRAQPTNKYLGAPTTLPERARTGRPRWAVVRTRRWAWALAVVFAAVAGGVAWSAKPGGRTQQVVQQPQPQLQLQPQPQPQLQLQPQPQPQPQLQLQPQLPQRHPQLQAQPQPHLQPQPALAPRPVVPRKSKVHPAPVLPP